ncbi:MAG: hypothetical protein V1721_09025 [Pseudomonadota bacterium]
MQESSAQKLGKAAAAAHKAFPEELKDLVVLTTSSELPAYIAPEIANRLAKSTAILREIVKRATDYMREQNSTGFTNTAYALDGVVVKLLALNENPKALFSTRFTREMKVAAVFDHEVGHLAVENGLPSGTVSEHLAECAATAYAALRHVQQFGKETEFFEYHNYASQIVFGVSPKHYTDDVIQRVKQLAEETDVSGLSLRETAELAGKIALECSLDEKTLEKISAAFRPVADAYKEAGGGFEDAFLQKCVQVMLLHKDDPDISKAGKRYLNYPPVKEYIKNKAKTEPGWEDALDFIKNPPVTPLKKSSGRALQASP